MSGSTYSNIRKLLDEAHTKLGQGDAVGALEVVISAVTIMGGQGAILPALQRAKEYALSGNSLAGNQVEELTQLFSDVSLAAGKTIAEDKNEGEGSTAGSSSQMHSQSQNSLAVGEPILTESGREGLTDCALADGSSFVCSQCGAVVSVARKEAHMSYWCQKS